jgi:hypothetical protein
MAHRIFLIIPIVLSLSCATGGKPADISHFDIATIEAVTGMTGDLNEKEGVYKLSVPRDDLRVTTAGVKMTPSMGLTAWAAFSKPSNHVMVMGDIVMTEGQVNTVMSAALDSGLEVTALHNHFFDDEPKIMFMHISGAGTEKSLAEAVRNVFNALQHSRNMTFPRAHIDPSKSTLNPKILDVVFKKPGTYKEGVYKITFGRKTEMEHGEAGNAMGVNTWVAATGSSKIAVVDGDFAMLESELQPVLRILRKANIQIVAIHNHMTAENPRIMFLHYWGVGPIADLAKGIKAALSAVSYGRD